MAQQGFIKFDPGKIAEVAADMQSRQDTLNQNLSEIRARADNYFNKLDNINREGEELAQMLKTMAGNLFRVSGRYDEGERAAVNKVEALPTQGVFRN